LGEPEKRLTYSRFKHRNNFKNLFINPVMPKTPLEVVVCVWVALIRVLL